MNRSFMTWALVATLLGIVPGCGGDADPDPDTSASRNGAGDGGADSGEPAPLDGAALDAGESDADGPWADAGLPDAGNADAGNDDPVVKLQPVAFTSCDLRTLDWEDVLPEEEISCESDTDNCRYWTPWLTEVIYADTDGDSIEEAWVAWSADITFEFGVGATESFVSVYVRDTACAVQMADISIGFDFLTTLTPVEGGVNLVLDNLGDERRESYRWVEGGLQLTASDGGNSVCLTAPDFALSNPDFACDPVPGTWTLEIVDYEGSSPVSRLYCGLSEDAVPNNQAAFDTFVQEQPGPDEIVTGKQGFVRAESCASGWATATYDYLEGDSFDRLLIWTYEN